MLLLINAFYSTIFPEVFDLKCKNYNPSSVSSAGLPEFSIMSACGSLHLFPLVAEQRLSHAIGVVANLTIGDGHYN